LAPDNTVLGSALRYDRRALNAWRRGYVEKLKNKPLAGLFELNAPHISTGHAEKSIIGWSKKPSQ
jgi:hypothetical protein